MKFLFPAILLFALFSCADEPAKPIDFIEDCEPQDYGIGIVVQDQFKQKQDTVLIFSNSDSSSVEIGKWYYNNVFLEDAVINGVMLEVFYEWGGLPVLESTPPWVKVIYNFGELADLKTGWINTDQDSIIYYTWSQILEGQGITYFRPCIDPQFYDSINGNQVDFALDYTYDRNRDIWYPHYDLVPQQTSGNWMQVMINSPSQYCLSEPTNFRENTLWIKYLDDSGSPRIWYYTRGC